RRDFLPVTPRSFWQDFTAALRFRLEHRLGQYNAVQKLFYWGVLLAVALMIASGLAIWKPVQTYPLELLFGGFQGARLVHFLVMAGIVLFLIVHVALVILVPKTFVAMVLGRASEKSALAERKRVMNLLRRNLLRNTLPLGALTLLTGCDVSDSDAVQRVLAGFSAWNDRVQAALFSGQRLAPTFPDHLAVKEFRYNAWYGPDKAPNLAPDQYRLQLAGRIADKRPWTVDQLHALPQVSQVTRHVCV